MLSQIIVKTGRNFSKQGGRGAKIAGKKSPLGGGLLAFWYQLEYLTELIASFPDVVLSVAIPFGRHCSFCLKIPQSDVYLCDLIPPTFGGYSLEPLKGCRLPRLQVDSFFLEQQ